MYFVNRDAAVKQLQDIHEADYTRNEDASGKAWKISLADNVTGLGKSEFGRHYIRNCREAWHDADDKSDFQKKLCECHTVHLVFGRGYMTDLSFDANVRRLLYDKLHKMFVKPPAILLNPAGDMELFLTESTQKVARCLLSSMR